MFILLIFIKCSLSYQQCNFFKCFISHLIPFVLAITFGDNIVGITGKFRNSYAWIFVFLLLNVLTHVFTNHLMPTNGCLAWFSPLCFFGGEGVSLHILRNVLPAGIFYLIFYSIWSLNKYLIPLNELRNQSAVATAMDTVSRLETSSPS